jgi:hypothetical protein
MSVEQRMRCLILKACQSHCVHTNLSRYAQTNAETLLTVVSFSQTK